ncbi:acetyltransferase (GNAT) family protein [Blastococcus colisei]|uniref:Acetyltransferase (GNAT) family protein n=1 Tax=Blastococcus colisei TaxID=1564162 RepID=A0A543PE85_9ACTN|nr:GNAT family N-acetyltransferase [Blastococcus colisei]TQN42401.1 acetyltransferase (GNAT) family protein [Blastococcus colisei]
MTDVDIRPATPAEAEQLLADSRRIFAESLTRHRGLSAEEAAAKAAGDTAALLPDGAGTPGHLFLAARREGNLTGGVWVAMRGPDRPDAAWIYHLWVAPSERRRGLGRRLVEEAADAVRERGARHLQLNVFGDNTGAIALYERMGFSITAQQMSRPLSES